jgi:hypothetical protein
MLVVELEGVVAWRRPLNPRNRRWKVCCGSQGYCRLVDGEADLPQSWCRPQSAHLIRIPKTANLTTLLRPNQREYEIGS